MKCDAEVATWECFFCLDVISRLMLDIFSPEYQQSPGFPDEQAMKQKGGRGTFCMFAWKSVISQGS